MRSFSIGFSNYLPPGYRTRVHLVLLAAFCLVTIFSAHAQTIVPVTVNLKPGFVGGKYEVPLTSLLPTGTNSIDWQLVPNGAATVTATDGTTLQKPSGVTVDNATKKLVVAPTSADLKVVGGKQNFEPYLFELNGSDGAGNQLTIRFSVVVKPFGVDESKIKSISGSVAGFTPAHEKPAEPVPGPTPFPFVLTTSTADEETIVLDRELKNAEPPVAGPDFSDENQGRVKKLIEDTVGIRKKVAEVVLVAGGGQKAVPATNFQAGDYLLTHVIVWKPAKAGDKGEARRELWGLFKAQNNESDETKVDWVAQGDPADKNVFNSRIFGGKRVAVLLIHFNTPAAWDVKYTVALNQRIPTPIQNLLTLAKGVTGGAEDKATASEPKTIWGARMMFVRYAASDMLVKVNAITTEDTPVEQAKDYSKKYLNEGRYHWDISVGLPIKSVKELEYKTDGNRVTTAAKERQSVYGFLNIFVKKVDLSGEKFLTPPHFVFGVPLATKPLHHPFAGIGYGVYKTPVKFNLFAGIVFNRERVPKTLQVGDAATEPQLESDLRTRWVRKFMFGINFPVSQIKDAIKK